MSAILAWFSAGHGRIVAAFALWLVVAALERVPAVGTWLNARPLMKRASAILLAIAPGAAAALYAGVPLADVWQTAVTAFMGATGLNALIPTSPDGSKPGDIIGKIGKAGAGAILVLMLAGCPAFWAALSKVEAGLPVLITAIEGAASAEADYAASHPDDPAVKAAAEKLKAAEDAAKALAAGTNAVKAAGSGDVSSLVAAAIAAYSDAKAAVDGLGAKVGEARAESKLVPVADVSAALGIESH